MNWKEAGVEENHKGSDEGQWASQQSAGSDGSGSRLDQQGQTLVDVMMDVSNLGAYLDGSILLKPEEDRGSAVL